MQFQVSKTAIMSAIIHAKDLQEALKKADKLPDSAFEEVDMLKRVMLMIPT